MQLGLMDFSLQHFIAVITVVLSLVSRRDLVNGPPKLAKIHEVFGGLSKVQKAKDETMVTNAIKHRFGKHGRVNVIRRSDIGDRGRGQGSVRSAADKS